MAEITLLSQLQQSTQGRAGTPDGNIFFDVANGTIELITVEELATIDFGSGAVANPLTNQDGISIKMLYAFERAERKTDEVLRQYDFYFEGQYKYSGAYEIVNGRKFASTDRTKIRGSGWIERAISGAIDRIYFGVRSLNNIESGSQPYYQLSDGGAPVNFAKVGPINEAVQVFGSTSNGDTGAGNFDSRTYLAVCIRTFGQTFSRKILADSGIDEMYGYASGFAVGESNNTENSYDLADVYGGAQVAPWTGMTLENFGAAQDRDGFVQGDDKLFSYILHNTEGGSLQECQAYLDAIAQTDDDIDAGAGVINGQRAGEWYSKSSSGQTITFVGLHIDNLPESDLQNVIQTADDEEACTYPFNVELRINVGDYAKGDANAWYHVYFTDGAGTQDFNTADAVTVQDKDGADIKGDVSDTSPIVKSFAYDTNTQAGLAAGIDKSMTVEVEGDGGCTQKKTVFLMERIPIVTVSCEPGAEANI